MGISARRRKEFEMSGELLLQCDAQEEFPAFAEGTLPAKFASTITRPTAVLRRLRGGEAWLGAFLKNRLFHSATHAYTPTATNVGNSINREKVLLMASDGATEVDDPNQPTKSGKAAKKAKTVIASRGTSNSPSDSHVAPRVKEATHRLVRLAPKTHVVESRTALLRSSPSKVNSSTTVAIHKSSANGLQPTTGDEKAVAGAEGSKETCSRSSMPQKRVKRTPRLSTFHGDALVEPSKPVKRAKITDYMQTAVATTVGSVFQTRGGANIAEEGKSGNSKFPENLLPLPPGKRMAATNELGRRRDNDDALLRPSKKVKTSTANSATLGGEPIPKDSISSQNIAEKSESERKRQAAGEKDAAEALMTRFARALVGAPRSLGQSFNSAPDPEGKQHAANPSVTKRLSEEGSPTMGLESGSIGEAFDVRSHLTSGPTTQAHPSQTVEASARPSTRLRVQHPPSRGDELKPTPVDDSSTSHRQELAKAAVGNSPADAVHGSHQKPSMERRAGSRKQDAERPRGGQREATLKTGAGVHSGVPVKGCAEEKRSHSLVDQRVYIAPRKYGKTPKELKAVKKVVAHLPPRANLLPEARKRKGGKGRVVLAHASTTKESLRPAQMEKTNQNALKKAFSASRQANSGVQRGRPRSGKGAASANQTHGGAARNRRYQAGTSDANEQGKSANQVGDGACPAVPSLLTLFFLASFVQPDGTRRGNANGHGAANTSGILLAAKKVQAARWGKSPPIERGSVLQSNLTILADDRTSNSKIDDGPASPMEHLSRLTQHTLQADGDLHFLETVLEEKIAEFVEKSSKVEHLRCKFPGASTRTLDASLLRRQTLASLARFRGLYPG
ncbi:hypothetical protein BBJ28_00018251 [Nothophytophthora sp. Chile5]|nr:hypothetical protein BBJ28_00018251 [Nothophytophthora sp. Chile5]